MESGMNGGDGSNSYAKNSSYQRITATTVKGEIEEVVFENLDVKTLSSVSSTIRLADLGCSTGPNTFIAMQSMLEVIKSKHASQCPDSESPEFQVFFNDVAVNDFNTLFTSLSDRQYFAAGVPGSFHGRLFPESSLHLVYSCYALHWLSKIPEEMLDKYSPAWNKGRIYYLNAPSEVYDAYRSQFYEDFDLFLNARAKEIVGGGMMVSLMMGLPNEVDPKSCRSAPHLMYDFMASTFMEMAKEGLIDESVVDSFNMPVYFATPAELFDLVEKNGCFGIEKLEFVKPITGALLSEFASDVVKSFRAIYDGILSKHFGSEFTDQMFERLDKRFRETGEFEDLMGNEIAGNLFLVLKRK